MSPQRSGWLSTDSASRCVLKLRLAWSLSAANRLLATGKLRCTCSELVPDERYYRPHASQPRSPSAHSTPAHVPTSMPPAACLLTAASPEGDEHCPSCQAATNLQSERGKRLQCKRPVTPVKCWLRV